MCHGALTLLIVDFLADGAPAESSGVRVDL
jgi:hypothetical protein